MNNLDKSLKNIERYYYRAVFASFLMLLFTIYYEIAFYPADGMIRYLNFALAFYLVGHFLLRKKVDILYQLMTTLLVISIYGGYIFIMGGYNSNGAYLLLIALAGSAIFLTVRTTLLFFSLDLVLIFIRLLTTNFRANDVIDVIGMVTVSLTIMLASTIVKSNLKKTIQDLNHANSKLVIEKNTVLKMASYDQLTQLANRNYFITSVKKTVRRDLFGSMLVFNVVDFHKINEVHGYKTGDFVLQSIGSFLKALIDERCIVGYLGNNTYALWINAIWDKEDIESKIQQHVSAFNDHHNVLLPLDVSSCVITTDFSSDKSVQDILTIAEKALNRMKKDNERFLFLDDQSYCDLNRQDQLSNYILRSIDDDNYINVYQEKYNTKTKSTYGLEVLSRLYHEGNFVSPEYFINLLEEKDKIVEFGIYTYRKVFQEMATIRENYGDDIVVSFNVSPKELVNPSYVKTLFGLLDEYQVSSRNIELEVTENVLISNLELLLPIFKELHNNGIQISLDDFGSGYSSLKYLVDLPIDTIKIDKSFMNEVEHNAIQKSVISSIIQIAEAKNISVVAEGIEKLSQSDLLYDMGCYKVQGYYYSRPQELRELINKGD